jgi:hypothetical protein
MPQLKPIVGPHIKRKAFFSEEKKQKTFVRQASAAPDKLGADPPKLFGSLFKKEPFLTAGPPES